MQQHSGLWGKAEGLPPPQEHSRQRGTNIASGLSVPAQAANEAQSQMHRLSSKDTGGWGSPPDLMGNSLDLYFLKQSSGDSSQSPSGGWDRCKSVKQASIGSASRSRSD
jgi:hypothetical protein